MSWNKIINKDDFVWNKKTEQIIHEKITSFDLHRSIFNISENEFTKYMLYIEKNISIKKCDSILEYGCGNGSILLYFKNKFESKSYGCDISKKLVKYAKQILNTDDIKECDNLNWLTNKSIDICICNSVLQYFKSEKYCLDKIREMIAKTKTTIFITDIKNKEYEKDFKYKQAIRQNLSMKQLSKKYKDTPLRFYNKKFFTDNFECDVLNMPSFYPDSEFESFSVKIYGEKSNVSG